MHVYPFFLFMMILAWPQVSQADSKAFCKKAKTNADLVQCLSDTYEKVQDDLRQSYDARMDEQKERGATDLIQGQKDWNLYKKSNCVWEANRQANESLRRITELSCQIRLTENRQAALDEAALPIAEQRKAKGHTPRWMNVLRAEYPAAYWQYDDAQIHDLNCDGRANFIARGVSVVAPQDRAADTVDLYEPYKVILGLATMAETGKPDIQVFDFPVHRNGVEAAVKTEAAEPSEDVDINAALPVALCSAQPDIAVIDVVQEDAREGPSNTESSCQPKVVQLSDGACRSYRIVWDEAQGFLLHENTIKVATE